MDHHETRPPSGGTRDLSDERLTKEVISGFQHSASPRFKEIMQSLVRHLHAFVSEVGLTEEEWSEGIEFLTRTGHITDDQRQEFILLSDVLGVSMLVVGINHRHAEGATDSGEAVEVVGDNGDRSPTSNTEATVFGPFFVEGAPEYQNGDDLANGAPGEPCFVSGRVLDIEGRPIAGAYLDIWQADEEGFYDVQYEGLDEPRGRGRLGADEEGRYRFWSVKPGRPCNPMMPAPSSGSRTHSKEAVGTWVLWGWKLSALSLRRGGTPRS